MSTISEKLQIIKNSELAMKQAIIDKGGTINGDITTWADSIYNIPSGGSGGSSSGKDDVTFYDYDGTILHSFSKDEFLALNELPSLPTQPGLICQEWNYDITNAKTYVEEYGKLNIGATYITNDGKTRLYIRIAAEGRMTVPLYFSQTMDNGVTIDWGDGSVTQTLSGTGNVNTSHTYTNIGDYMISLDVADGCTLGLGHNTSGYCVMGSTNNIAKVYCNMLQKIEIGTGVTSIGDNAFGYCWPLSLVAIPGEVTSIGNSAFDSCYSLRSVIIPSGVTSIGNTAFSNCSSLNSAVMPSGVTSIGDNAFYFCVSLNSLVIPNAITTLNMGVFYGCGSLSLITIPNSVNWILPLAFGYCFGVAFYDFSNHTAVPTLLNTSAFVNIPSDCKMIVPDNLYDTWIVANNWSTYASNIIKKSDWDAL